MDSLAIRIKIQNVAINLKLDSLSHLLPVWLDVGRFAQKTHSRLAQPPGAAALVQGEAEIWDKLIRKN